MNCLRFKFHGQPLPDLNFHHKSFWAIYVFGILCIIFPLNYAGKISTTNRWSSDLNSVLTIHPYPFHTLVQLRTTRNLKNMSKRFLPIKELILVRQTPSNMLVLTETQRVAMIFSAGRPLLPAFGKWELFVTVRKWFIPRLRQTLHVFIFRTDQGAVSAPELRIHFTSCLSSPFSLAGRLKLVVSMTSGMWG